MTGTAGSEAKRPQRKRMQSETRLDQLLCIQGGKNSMWPTTFADAATLAPSVGGGFVAGLITLALARVVLGIDRQRIRDLSAVEAKLDEAKSTVSGLTAAKARLEAELVQITPRARAASGLEQEIVRLRKLDSEHQSSLEATGKHLASALEELETYRSTAQYYEDELGRLTAKYDELAKTSYVQLSEATRLLTDLNDRVRTDLREGIDPEMHESEVAALVSTIKDLREEAEDLRTQITARPPDGIDPEMHESEVAALLSTVQALRMELAASESTVEQSRAVLEQCSGLKDALQAVNRIASKLPEQDTVAGWHN